MSGRGIEVILLGAAQDGGFPQFGCSCRNCTAAYNGEIPPDSAVSLAVVDYDTSQWWLFDATPQLGQQWLKFAPILSKLTFAGTFLTHAHAGHYPGIMYFGKEALDAHNLPLYCSADMHSFLRSNEPWAVMYRNKNITPVTLLDGVPISLSPSLEVTPFSVVHRADFTDTFAFSIKGPKRVLFFCPDIDSWQCCQDTGQFSSQSALYQETLMRNRKNILFELIMDKDILLLDATFYDNNELLNRDMSLIPHPRVTETVAIVAQAQKALHDTSTVFNSTSNGEDGHCIVAQPCNKPKEVVLIHLNHSNCLWSDRVRVKSLWDQYSIGVGREGMTWNI